MGDPIEQSKALKQALKAFVLDADGPLAIALETYSANHLRRWSEKKLQGVNCSNLAIDMFTTEGSVIDQSVLDIFIREQSELSDSDRTLLTSWKGTFNGLFVVQQVTSEGYELMNWLTAKRYWVKPNGLQPEEQLARLLPNEVVIARLSPLTQAHWIFSGPLFLLGKLGKPKLAVAIGNFKDWFPHHLYGDAPELLEEAWKSVNRYHDGFVQFFGAERLTLSGYELNKKFKAYQDFTTQRQLEDAGIDGSQTFEDLVSQAGVSTEEITESVESLGEDGRQVSRLIKSTQAVKMMMPAVDLPDEFRKAEAVTVFVHPRWGQTFLKDYKHLADLLDAADETSTAKADLLIHQYLKEETVNAYVWHCFAEEKPDAVEASLRRVLQRPDFSLREGLDQVLLEFDKSLEPQLPEIASVPLHLHNLFQEALQEVSQNSSKKKSKGKRKQKTGFGGA